MAKRTTVTARIVAKDEASKPIGKVQKSFGGLIDKLKGFPVVGIGAAGAVGGRMVYAAALGSA